MYSKVIPLEFEGIHESIYAGFWARLGSLFIDGLIIKVAVFFTTMISEYFYNLGLIAELAIIVFYYVYLVKRYGGTPGKRIMNMKIIKMNGEDISWREAFLRESVSILLNITFTIISMYVLWQFKNGIIDEYELDAILEGESEYWLSGFMIILGVFVLVWVWSELIVMLFNDRKRALHDFLAGTVVVKDIYIDDIREEMKEKEEDVAIENEIEAN